MTPSESNLPPGECIVRVVKPTYHCRPADTLTKRAFLPNRGASSVSVLRYTILGSDECKRIAVHIIAPRDYGGLADAVVEVVTHLGVHVVDRPIEEFDGHAEIEYGIRRPDKPEPLDPASNLQLNAWMSELARLFVYRVDPDVASPIWKGPCPCGACPQRTRPDAR